MVIKTGLSQLIGFAGDTDNEYVVSVLNEKKLKAFHGGFDDGSVICVSARSPGLCTPPKPVRFEPRRRPRPMLR